ncbi:MAG: ABC transporter ATP-binding protein [Chromatiaceae bacterium]|nr:MAG: ABC transporter ATP-binding protein [Chromatiaceae bacterium]
MANPIRDIPHYLKLFQIYLGRRIYILFALALASSLAEGLGIVMLLPLLQSLDGIGGDAVGGFAKTLNGFIAALGLGESTVAILLIICAFFLLKGLLLFLAGVYRAHLNTQLQVQLKGRLFNHYSRMRYQYYASRDTGHFINVLNAQVAQFLGAFGSLVQLGATVIMTATYLVLAFVVAWRFGLIALVLGVLLLLLFQRLNRFVRELSRANSREAGLLTKLLVQTLQAFKYLTATGQFDHLRHESMGSIQRLAHNNFKLGVARSFTSSILEPIAVVSVVLIVIIKLSVLQQPIAPILVSILLFKRGLNAVLGIQSGLQTLFGQVGSVEMVRDEFNQQRQHREADGTQPVPPFARAIELRDVHFAYNPALGNVIKGVSLTIPSRTSVALVGESGAGKSTLVDLLTLMLKPDRGQVLIDGIPGDQIQLASWRCQLGYVSQETVVFDDSIANNICLWQGDPRQDQHLMQRVREAARQAYIDQFIETLPEGYHTLVGDRGIRLSGGQRQRLFIARELFRKPNLLILDEATSALDTESERFIQRSIDALKGETTVVIIAHRLSTIRNVDRVYVFDQGRLVEEGAYEELRDAHQSRFGKLVAMQAL